MTAGHDGRETTRKKQSLQIPEGLKGPSVRRSPESKRKREVQDGRGSEEMVTLHVTQKFAGRPQTLLRGGEQRRLQKKILIIVCLQVGKLVSAQNYKKEIEN